MSSGDATHKPSLVALKSERERTIEVLTAAFAADLFDVDEFDSRVGKALEATTCEALVSLRSDVEGSSAAAAPQRALTTTGTEAQQALLQAQPASKGALALLGGCERKGRWRVPKKLRVGAVLGGCELDFREALIAPGISEVKVFALLGGVEILVPPDVHVECEGIGILGGFEGSGGESEALEQRPTLRISGIALLGGVNIATRLVGESARDAKKRLKRERKALQAARSPKQLNK
jgi:hypothetical protein